MKNQEKGKRNNLRTRDEFGSRLCVEKVLASTALVLRHYLQSN